MELVEKTGVCRFCGQNKIVEVPDNFTDEEINEEASKECYCIDAKHYKESLELKAMVEQQKISAQGEIFKHFNNDYPLIEKIFNDAIDPIVNNEFIKMTIVTDDGVTAYIKKKKGGIKVGRSYKDEQSTDIKIYDINNA